MFNHFNFQQIPHLNIIFFQIGEFVQDFVEVRRNFDSWNPPIDEKSSIVAAGDRHGGFTDLHAHETPRMSADQHRVINEKVDTDRSS